MYEEFMEWIKCLPPPPPRFDGWECGEDIACGQLVYGVSRVYVMRCAGRMPSRFARGIAVGDGKKGDKIQVQTYGMCSIPVDTEA